jgi:hypothetical protein
VEVAGVAGRFCQSRITPHCETPPRPTSDTAAAQACLIVWCHDCRHRAKPGPGGTGAPVWRRDPNPRMAPAPGVLEVWRPRGRLRAERGEGCGGTAGKGPVSTARVRSRCLRSPTGPHCTKVICAHHSGKHVVGGRSSVFESARTRVAVLEIMKDDLVTMALQDPMDSRTANSSAWAQMAGVIMRFS